MKVPIWLFKSFPFLFPRTRKAATTEIEKAFKERWNIVTDKLHVEGVSRPSLKISKSSKSSYKEGIIVIAYSAYLKGRNQLCHSIDHEIAHHVQHCKNQTVTVRNRVWQIDRDIFYWVLKDKMHPFLTKRAFSEGFAMYVDFLINGKFDPKFEAVIKSVLERKAKILFSAKLSYCVPYVLGFLAYSAIAELESEEQAIQSGLLLDPQEWLSKSKNAISKLGKFYPI
jgi:hypothetical protein